MPYTFPDVPDKIKDLPKEAQRIWVKVFNSAWETYKDRAERERLANSTAWAALKKAGWIKKDDKWVKEASLEIIDVPYSIEDKVLLKEGIANGIFYSGEEIEKTVNDLNSPVDMTNLEERNKNSLFYDHDEKCENWLGEIKNFRYDSEKKALIGDIDLMDEDVARKTKYQKEQGVTHWGISPRLILSERDGKAYDIKIKTFSLVLRPAGGSDLMLTEEFVELDDLTDRIEFDKEEGENVKETKEKKLKELAEEFQLTPEQIKNFSPGQIKLLEDASTKENKSEEIRNSGEEILELAPILCFSEEEQTVTSIVLEPEKEDTKGNTFPEEVIRESMIDYMMNYRVLDIEHMDKQGKYFPLKERRLGKQDRREWDDDLRLIENYQTLEDQAMGEPPRMVRKGTWIQTWKILNSRIWEGIKAGEYAGFSPGGMGV